MRPNTAAMVTKSLGETAQNKLEQGSVKVFPSIYDSPLAHSFVGTEADQKRRAVLLRGSAVSSGKGVKIGIR